jgi:CheY-like chemotaxis protein
MERLEREGIDPSKLDASQIQQFFDRNPNALVVEDEPLIAMDIAQGLKTAGASVSVARTLSDALTKVEAPDLSAAVLDHRLNDGNSSRICDRLDVRNIPFVVYSGFAKLDGACGDGAGTRRACPSSASGTGLIGRPAADGGTSD